MIKKFIIGSMLVLLFTLFGLPWLVSVGQGADTPTLPYPNSHFETFYHTRIHYRTWNPEVATERKVLLIHGFSGSTFSFRKLIPLLLAEGYAVTAVDLPAYGYSDREIGEHTLPDPVLCWLLLRTVDLQTGNKTPWVIAGHSMGASVAAAIAANWPTQCSRLILIDGVPTLRPGNGGTGGLLTTGIVRRWAEILARYVFITPGRIEKLLTSAYSQPAPAEAVQGYLEPLKVNGTADAILKKFRYTQALPKDSIPDTLATQVIWGEKDSWIPIQVGNTFLEKHPFAQKIIIPEAGHCPMETHPQECLPAFQ